MNWDLQRKWGGIQRNLIAIQYNNVYLFMRVHLLPYWLNIHCLFTLYHCVKETNSIIMNSHHNYTTTTNLFNINIDILKFACHKSLLLFFVQFTVKYPSYIICSLENQMYSHHTFRLELYWIKLYVYIYL